MKSILTICSEGIALDRRSNNITVYNILEEIHSIGFPLVIQRLFFYSWIIREDKDSEEIHNLHFEVSIDGEKIFTQGIRINFNKKPRSRTIIEIGGLAIHKIGNLCFKLSYKSKKLGEYCVIVKAVDKPNIKVSSGKKQKNNNRLETHSS